MTAPGRDPTALGVGWERPILFSAPMVRALLNGTKTQTRRVVKPQPFIDRMGNFCVPDTKRETHWNYGQRLDGSPCWREFAERRCPYGRPGHKLWVRETWGVGNRPCPSRGWVDGIEYRADCTDDCAPPLHDIIPDHVEADSIRAGWRPSIHMPRWASRITLRITDVRVERLNSISEADARAEGCRSFGPTPGGDHDVPTGGAVEAYQALWEHINGDGSWAANPWVWVVGFERVTP
jgi:hypothetical protein